MADRRVRECPPAVPFVFGVGITGHRKETIPPKAVDGLKARVTACSIDRPMRKNERPSDHAPVVAEIGPIG